MKILHTSDWHLGAYVGVQCDDPNKRMEHTKSCLNELLHTASVEKPDVILISGDLFHASRAWSDRAMIEAQVAMDYVESLASFAPVVVLFGTPNHDNLETFKTMEKAFRMFDERIYFIYEPQLLPISTANGLIQVAGLPGFDKGFFRAKYPGLSAEEENHIFREELGHIIQGLNAQLASNVPSVLMAHHTVVGCELDNGNNVFASNDVVLTTSVLDSSDFDIVCLGHIHKPQKLKYCTKSVFYAGAIDAFTFNDEGSEKGFWIHDITDNDEINSKYYETKYRKFFTCKWDSNAVKDYIENGLSEFDNLNDLKDKVVRVLYSCDSDTEKILDKKKLERDLYNVGAYYVSEIRPEKITTSVNRELITEKMTVEACLKHYLTEKKIENLDSVLESAIPLITEANKNSVAGSQVGLFLPLEIEVKNYRSYESERIDFSDIYFAMVNGQNGCGKSSLFMDAIVDCLYEQPREGELTGWIKTNAKSGAIYFTFVLGNSIWRVVRTRQKSGKATLALSRLDSLENEWSDHSCQKLVDTQRKIIELLGMDCNTFQSCVLIMQDKYGLFLEAKPEERMSILANLLGLGVYDKLEALAKDKLRDVNRDIKSLKEDSTKLEKAISDKESLELEYDKENKQLSELNNEIETMKEEEALLNHKLVNARKLSDEISMLQNEIIQINQKSSDRCKLRDELHANMERTTEFLKLEEYYTMQHDKFVKLQSKISYSKAQTLIVQEKEKALEDKRAYNLRLENEVASLQESIENIKKALNDKGVLEGFINNNSDLKDKIRKIEVDKQDSIVLTNELNRVNSDLKSHYDISSLKVSSLDKQIEDANEKIKMLGNSNCIDPENARCRFLADAVLAKDSIEIIKKELDDYKYASKQVIEKLTEEKETLETKLEANEYDEDLKVELDEKLEKYNEYAQKLAILASKESELIENNNKLNEARKLINQVNSEIKELELGLHELKLEYSNNNSWAEDFENLKSDEEKYHKIPSSKQYLDDIKPQFEALQEDCVNIGEDIKKKDERLKQLIKENTEKSSEIEKRLTCIKEQLKENNSRITFINRTIGSLEERLKLIEQKEDELKAKVDKIKELACLSVKYQVLVQAFSQEGIPHQIIRDIIPELEASANEILAQMTNGWMRVDFNTEKTLKSNKSKEIATLEVITSDADNGIMPYLSRSGGQRTRINLAVGFALAMIKASRVGLQLGMLFVDEPSWLDERGIEEYCMALKAIHNKYPEMRILAISHDMSMKMSFPQQLFVERTKEGSKVRRV